jgi:PAS domain S-box-containing protein
MASTGVPEVVHDTLLAEAWQNAHVAAVVFDEGRTYLTANRTYLELVGYSRDEIAALRAGANILADEEGRLAYLELITRRQHLDGSAPLRRKDGEVFMADYVIVPTLVSRMPFFMALMWPTDERRVRPLRAAQ